MDRARIYFTVQRIDQNTGKKIRNWKRLIGTGSQEIDLLLQYKSTNAKYSTYFPKSSRKPENEEWDGDFSWTLFSKCSSLRIPKSIKKPSITFNLSKYSLYYIEHNITYISVTNLSFELIFFLFLFQTEMVRNYLNFRKSQLNFRCFKKIGRILGGEPRGRRLFLIPREMKNTWRNKTSDSS